MTPDGATGMHWLSDTILGLDYVVITGEDQEAYADALREVLPCVSVDELRELSRAHATWYDQVDAINLVAAGAPPVRDDVLFDFIARSLGHEHRTVRNAGLVAVAYLGWPELYPMLALARLSDSEPELRTLAEQLLSALETGGSD